MSQLISVSLIVIGFLIIIGIVFFPKQHKLPNIVVIPDGMRLEVAIETAIADGENFSSLCLKKFLFLFLRQSLQLHLLLESKFV